MHSRDAKIRTPEQFISQLHRGLDERARIRDERTLLRESLWDIVISAEPAGWLESLN
jgi:hypothetical protein